MANKCPICGKYYFGDACYECGRRDDENSLPDWFKEILRKKEE